MPRLLLLTAGEISRDPRARRAGAAAVERGLVVLGVCHATAPPIPLPGVEVARVPSPPSRPSPIEPPQRSVVVRELRGLGRLARLLRANLKLARAARPLAPFDIVHANDLETLPAAAWLARRGARLVYDAHELSTRQEVDPPRLFVLVARAIERRLARRAAAIVTVGPGLATALAADLRLVREPIVVLNCPPTSAAVSADPSSSPLRAIYQGAMGPGRSVADLLEAAAFAEGVLLTIRIQGVEIAALQALVDERELVDRLRVEAPVPPDRLDEGLAGHHVGLIINRPVTRNDELVLPNKLFEYLMAGLAVVAPNLPDLAQIVEAEDVGLLAPPGDPSGLGTALAMLASDRDRLAEMQRRARAAALSRYNAEAQAKPLALAWGVA